MNIQCKLNKPFSIIQKTIASLATSVSAFLMAVLAAVIVGWSGIAQGATTYYWDFGGTPTTLWTTTANWSTAVGGSDLNADTAGHPVAGDTAIFNVTARSAVQTVTMSGDISVAGLVFNTSGTTAINTDGLGNRKITVGTGGITINSGAGAVTFGTTVANNRDTFTLGGAQTWKNDSGTLTLNANNSIINGGFLLTIDGSGNITTATGAITGTGGITKNGGGTLSLGQSSSSYTGPVTINAGVVNVTTFAIGGSNSGLGASAATADKLIFGGGTLMHNAVNVATTDRLFTIGNANGETATLDSSSVAVGNGLAFTGTGSIAFGNTNPHTLTLTGSNTGTANTFAPIIGDNTGATSVSKTGIGTWALSGANTFSGGLTVSGGTLSFATDGTSGGQPLGAYPGSPSAAAVTLNGGTLLNTASTAIPANRGITLGAGGGVLDASASQILTVASVITGSGFLTKGANTGTVILSGANTYTGITTNNAGTLQADRADVGGVSGALGYGGDITFTGGTLQYTANSAGTDYSTRFKNSTSAIKLDDNGQTITLAGIIDSSNSGGLTKSGAGAVILSGANAYSGTTTLSGGTLITRNNQALSSSSLSITTGATAPILDLQQNTTAYNTALTGVNNATILVDSLVGSPATSASYTLGTLAMPAATLNVNLGTTSGNLTSGTLNLGTVTLSGTPATFNIGAGVVLMPGAINASFQVFKTGLGTLVANTTSASRATQSTLSAGTLQLGAYGAWDTNAQNLNVNGTSTLVLAPLNDTGGTFFGCNPVISGASTLTIITTRGTTQGAGINNTIGAILGVGLGGATLTVNGGGSVPTVNGGVNNVTSGIAQLTSGAITLTGNTTFTINNNTAGGTTLFSDSSTLAMAGFNLGLSGNGDFTVAGIISTASGSPSITLNSDFTGVATFNSANTYAGGLNIQNGTAKFSNTTIAQLGMGLITIGSATTSGILDLGGGTHTISALATAGTAANQTITSSAAVGVLTYAGATTSTFGGVIAGGANTAVTVNNGSAKLTLSGQNTYSGATTLTAGELDATTYDSALGAGVLTLNGAATLRLANDTGLNFARPTTISSSMTIQSDTLTGVAGVTHTLGTLSIGTYTLTVAGGATLASGTAGVTFGATTLTGNPTFTVTNPGVGGTTLTLGALSGGASARTITKSGNGTLTLGTGATSLINGTAVAITAGTLNANHATALGALAAVDVADGATLGIGASQTIGSLSNTGSTLNNGSVAIGGAYTLTLGWTNNLSSSFSGVIGGASGALTKAGSGTLTLSGANTYSGATTVSVGTLLVSSPGSLASGSAVVVANGATLGGNGTINGPASVASGGTLAPGGVGTIGLFSLGTNLTSSTSFLAFDLTSTNTAGTTYDQIAVSGTNIVTGLCTIRLNPTTGTISAGTYTLMTYAALSGSGQFVFPNGTTNLTLGGNTLTLANGPTSLILAVNGDTAYANLKWKGTSALWDIGTTANWLNGTSTTSYSNGNAVTFDDTAASYTVTGTNLQPGSVLFNSVTNYTVSASSNTIAGSTAVTKMGTGTLTLSGTNTFSGGLNILAGTVGNAGGSSNSFGSGTITLGDTTPGNNNAATLSILSGTGAYMNPLIVAAGSTGVLNFFKSGSVNETYGGSVALNNNLLIGPPPGNWDLTFSGLITQDTGNSGSPATITTDYANHALNFSGGIAIGNGGLTLKQGSTTLITVSTGGITGTGSLILNSSGAGSGGSFIISSGVNNSGSITNTGAGAGNTTLSGVISNNVTAVVQNNANNTLTLSGANTYTGPTTITQGTLQIGSGGATGSLSPSSAINNNGTLKFYRSNSITQGVDFASAITGSGGVYVVGGATVVFSGLNTFTGPITVEGGNTILQFDSIKDVNGGASALGAPTDPTSGTITLSNGGSAGKLTYVGTGDTSDRILNISGANAYLIQSGSGPLKFTSNMTAPLAGAKTLNLLGSAAGSGELAGAIVNGNGTTALIKTGSGTWILSGANTYTGVTTLNVGTLQADRADVGGISGALGSGGNITFTGGTLQYTANSSGTDYSARFKSSTSAIILDSNGQTITLDGIIDSSNIGGLTKSGAGTITLSGANTYSGSTTLTAGQLNINNSGSGGITSAIGTGTLIINGGTIDNTSAGTVTLSPNNAVTLGADFIYGGTKDLNLGTGAAAFTLPSGAGTRTITLNGTGRTLTVGGAVAYNSSSGTSTVTVNGPGNTLVFGSLSLNTITSGARATIWNGTANVRINGGIAYGGYIGNPFAYSGSGTLTVGGTSTYTGNTTISAGRVIFNGTMAATATTVTGVGTLGGSGILTGTVAVNSGATLSPGDPSVSNGVGTLTISNTLTMASGSTNNFELIDQTTGDTVALSTTPSFTGVHFNLYQTNGMAFGRSGTYTLITCSGTPTFSGLTVDNLPSGVTASFHAVDGKLQVVLISDGIWTGAGPDGNWSTGSNWDGNSSPSDGTTLIFASAGGWPINTNNNHMTSVAGITFSSGGGAFTLDSTSLMNLQGNIVSSNASLQTLRMPLQLTGATRTINAYAGDIALSGVISADSATPGLTKTGANTLTLSGANTYSNATTISAGTLQISAASNLGSGVVGNGISLGGGTLNSTAGTYALGTSRAIVLSADAATIKVDEGTLTVDGMVSGAFNLTKSGNGTLLMSATVNTFGGSGKTFTIGAGTMQLGAGTVSLGTTANAASVTAGATLDLNGKGFTTANSLTINGQYSSSIGAVSDSSVTAGSYAGTVTLASDSSIGGNNGDITLSGVLSGNFNLKKVGSNALTLSNPANTFGSGTTTFTNDAGTVKLGAVTTALGATGSKVWINSGAALDLNGKVYTTDNPLTLNGAGISSGGALINSSATAGFYTGLVTLGSASSIIAGSGNITLGNVGTITGAGFGLTVGGAYNTSISSIIGTGAGTVTKQDAGTLTLLGTNTYTGVTTISAGTLTIGGSGQLNSGSYAGNISNSGTLNYGSSADQTLSGIISQPGALTVSGSGTLTLSSGANTYGGVTTISLGTLSVGAIANATVASDIGSYAIADASGLILSGGTLSYTGAGATSDRGFTFQTANSTINISTPGATLTLGASTFNKNGGQLSVTGGSGSALALGSVALSQASVIDVANGVTLTLGSLNTGGTPTLTKQGAGLLTVNAVGTRTGGATIITAGTLKVGSGGSIDALGNSGITIGPGTLWYAADTSVSGASSRQITTVGNATVIVDRATLSASGIAHTNNSFALGGYTLTIQGGGNVTGGTASMAFTGDSSLTGSTTIELINPVAGGTTLLMVRALAAAGNNLTLKGNGNFIQGVSVISGSGSQFILDPTYSGTATLNQVNTFTGGVTLNAGTLNINHVGVLNTSGPLGNGGTFTINGGTIDTTLGAKILLHVNPITLGGNFTFAGASDSTHDLSFPGAVNLGGAAHTITTSGSGGTLTLSGVLSNGGFIKNGLGKLLLTGANNYSGPTTIGAGSLVIGGSGLLGSANYAGAITNNGVLLFGSTASQTLSGEITGTGSLITTNTGTLTLSGANTYTGATTVSNGTLLVNGSLASGSAVTVVSRAFLGGNGTVNGPVTVSSGGALAPGGVGAMGLLTLSTNLTISGSLVFDLTSPGVAGTDYDQLSVAGTNILNGSTVIQLNPTTGTITNGTYTLMTYGARSGGQFVFANGSTNMTLGAGTLTLTNGPTSLVLGVSADAAFVNLTWKGTTATWDIGTASNWLNNGSTTTYSDGSAVTFDDTASGYTVNGTNLQPSSVLFNNANAYTVSASTNTIAGTASVTKMGSGLLTLKGTNTFSGGLNILAGTVTANPGLPDSFGTGAITLGNGLNDGVSATWLLQNNSNVTNNNPIIVASGSSELLSIVKGVAENQYLGGAVQLGSSLTISNSVNWGVTFLGLITETSTESLTIRTPFSGSSSRTLYFKGGMAVGTGGLTLFNPDSTVVDISVNGISGSGPLTLNNSSNGSFAVSSTIDPAGSLIITGTGTGGTTLSGNISNNVTSVIKDSPSATLTLSGSNTFTGGLFIKAGTVTASTSASALGGGGTGTVTLGDATGSSAARLSLGITGLANPITLVENANTTLTINPTASLTYSGAITGAHDLFINTQSSGATTFLSINNTGAITTESLGGNAGNVNITTVGNNVTSVTYGNLSGGTITTLSSLATVLTNNSAGTLTVTEQIAGSGNLSPIVNSTGGITLAGGANHSGAITNISPGAGNLSITGVISNNVTAVVQNSATSVLILGGVSNSFTGGLFIRNGRVKGGNNNNTFGPDTSVITLGDSTVGQDATLEYFSGTLVQNPITITAGGGSRTIFYNNGGGSAKVLGGAVTLNNNLAITTGASPDMDLNFSGGFTGVGNLTMNGNGTKGVGIILKTAAVNNTGSITNAGTGSASPVAISANIGPNVIDVVQNSGTSWLTLSGKNIYSNTMVLAGSMTISGLTTNRGSTTITNGTLRVNGTNTVVAGWTGNYTVRNGGVLGGMGRIDLSAVGSNVIVEAGGQLSPGSTTNAVGTNTFSLGVAGQLDLRAAAGTSGTLIYQLGPTNASDRIVLASGVLNIGNGLLNMSSFNFTNSVLDPANIVYTLIHTTNTIVGTLAGEGGDAFVSGKIGWGDVTGILYISDDGKDLMLQLTGGFGPPKAVTWQGRVSAVWESGSTNWVVTGGSSPTNFMYGDAVTFDDSGVAATISSVFPVTPGSITDSSANNAYTLSAKIIGACTVTKQGTSLLTLSGGNTFSGGVVIKSGGVNLGSTTAAGTVGITLGDTTGSSAAGLYASGVTISNAITLASNANKPILAIGNLANTTATFAGGVTGTGNLILTNKGSAVLSFSAGSLLNPVGVITNAGAGTGTVTINSVIGANVTALVQNSATSKLTLSGVNTYQGPTTVNRGILALGSGGSIDHSSSITIASGATCDVSAISGYVLSTNLTVASTAVVKGDASLDFGSHPITVNYNGTQPVSVTATSLQLNGNDFVVNGTALALNSTRVILQASGSITDAGSHTVSGTALGGRIGVIAVTADQVILTIPPDGTIYKFR
jgi:autotransporter-associated beta strand protein